MRRHGLGRRVRRLNALRWILELLRAGRCWRALTLQGDSYGRGVDIAQRGEARLERTEAVGDGGVVMQTLQQLLDIVV